MATDPPATPHLPSAPEPNGLQILRAIENVGESFHGLHLKIDAISASVETLRTDWRESLQQIGARIDSLRDLLERYRRKLDDRMDKLWTDVDQLRLDMQTLAADVERLKTAPVSPEEFSAFQTEVRAALTRQAERLTAIEESMETLTRGDLP
jgi:septation ring formation regulator EzrA